MKYAVLTPLAILDANLIAEITALAQDRSMLEVTTCFSDQRLLHNQLTCFNDPEQHHHPIYQKYVARYTQQGPGDFSICKLPTDIEARLFARLPAKIKNMARPPYVRLQLLQNYQIFPHVDHLRHVSLFVPVTANALVETIFYDVTQAHEFFNHRLPDPDLIKEKARFRFAQGECWLFDNDSIHATQHQTDELRISVNFVWSDLHIPDILPLIFN